ncbi:unnamed protein product [Spirodela intermedia]|uniref:ABC transporter domain-containing protein n=1 Tax=Spirodela intermedia TaxID=51605 RepID=A0A7I8I988_SPIIN|nr:unnamed protein product [Spirodela intermedia]CAA6654054.1 unnamed protein product [Spirodela intermedia]
MESGGRGRQQLRAMLRKNWLLKIRHPFATAAELLLPTFVMLLLIGVRTRVDTQIHPVQAYIRRGMFVEVGKSEVSPDFESILQLLVTQGEHLAFVPDSEETRAMVDVLSLRFPLLKVVGLIYKDELELETYIRSDSYGVMDPIMNLSKPKLKGAIVFHEQGPHSFDYSIRLNHTWAFSGFPDVKTIMDVNGPYLNDLDLGVSTVPTLQYSMSGFFTLQQLVDSFIILASQNSDETLIEHRGHLLNKSATQNHKGNPWSKFSPANIRVAPFPTRAYTDDEFQSIIKNVMAILYLLGFLYPISRLLSYYVFEKENKIKEGLYMMGLKDEIFYLSWLITYALQFAASSAIITVCTMANLFKYSDKSLVFVYFFLFGLSAVMLSFLISTFFSRAKTAVAVGSLTFLGAFFPYYTVNDSSVSMSILCSVLSPTAFALGTVNFADYERAHVGLRWTNMWQESSGVNFLVCLLMMMLDTVLYGVLGLYFDKVLPRDNGVRYPWNFLFTKLFSRWRNCALNVKNQASVTCGEKPAIEAISLDMKQQELDGRCIQVKNLHKVFVTSKGKCCAVKSLQLTLFENQILALLGAIDLLNLFWLSSSLMSDEIRKCLGVCPQNDILFPELTVKEHLEIFGTLKGVDPNFLAIKVMEMVDEVGLADKISTTVGALSGGMKRKLSLGIALIGDSKVIILDEPTSGMDPYSMRSTWQLIKRIRKGRIVLLTTHSMDEADVLGDRIAIMANGSLKCCGSSLYLKHQYGVGYTLTVVKASPASSVAADIVYRHVPSATCLSDVGTEISFRLPLASSSSFENMFREIEGCNNRGGGTGGISTDNADRSHGIESYGISVTTLEEVFLKVAGSENPVDSMSQIENDAEGSQCILSTKSSNSKISCGCWMLVFQMICSGVERMCSVILSKVTSFIAFFTLKFCCCEIIMKSTFWNHFKALLIKRALSARRDRRTVIFQLLIPVLFMLFGFLSLKLKPHPDQCSITFTTSHFNPLLRGDGGGWIQKQQPRSFEFPDPEKTLADAIDAAGESLGPALISMSEFLITSLNESYQSRYGAVVMDDVNDDGSLGYTVLHNSSCQHAAPTYINLMNAAILRLAAEERNMTIQTRNHPLPMTMSQKLQHHDLDAFSAAIIVSIAFSFIPASFAVTIVKEREVKAKHQQLISGVCFLPLSFAFFFSHLIHMPLVWKSKVLHETIGSCVGLNQFVGSGSILPTVFIFLGYGLSVASSTYCLTFFFSDHTAAQNVILLVHFLSGLILMVISFIMGLIRATSEINSVLKNIFRFSPSFCFADGLASLALRRQGIKLGSGTQLDWNVTGASICYLGFESVVYFLLTIALELLPSCRFSSLMIKEWWQSFQMNGQSLSPILQKPLLEPSKTDVLFIDEDIDVRAERERVLSGFADNAIIYLRNLRKVYNGGRNQKGKVAVSSLSFSVQEGECFGFLGTNGAGKTTTLSMLSGEEYPTDGTAYIFGKDIRMHPKAARKHVGYCPQFDALLEFLTVREHLELYARIKAVSEMRIKQWGNKRKLSVAIAMIGDPPIVILDEPSTGMDPIAKRFMWEVISRLSTRRGKTAVILTTHSMAEAQALCTRIGIMVAGQLRCIGSPQHLKTRFGNHLELEVKPTEVNSTELDELCKRIQEVLSDFPCHSRGILGDLEICIGGSDTISSENVSEISLTREMISVIARHLGHEESIRILVSSEPTTSTEPSLSGTLGEQLSEQLLRDGGIPLRIFSEWWLATEKFFSIDKFILTSFHGATFHGCNGLSSKYQLPYGESSSLADIFGHTEHHRRRLGIAEYSVSQSTLETIFNHFAASQ